jgi:NAD(P)-dependent dehydrogenase (short-subunit alcohol dehydrogenase family)
MEMALTMGRVAVVTGGGSGLGLAICRSLAARGCAVAVADIDPDAAGRVASDLRDEGHRALAVTVDVSDRGSVDRAFDTVRGELGPIAILVTSAAIVDFTPFAEITIESWNRMIAVNLTGTFHCAQAALPDMVAAGWGRVVLIASDAGVRGSIGQGHYSASKGGVIAMMKTLALEYAAHGITVNAIPPFAVETPGLARWRDAGVLPSAQVLSKAIPAGRLGQPEDVAAV